MGYEDTRTWRAGFRVGVEVGYATGALDGIAIGYTLGYAEGYRAGYREGYTKGLHAPVEQLYCGCWGRCSGNCTTGRIIKISEEYKQKSGL